MFPSAAGQKIAGKIFVVNTLADDHNAPLFSIVEAVQHHREKFVVGVFQ